MNLPWHDWQFYVVTLAAIGGLWLLWRTFAPRRAKGGSCPTCGCGRADTTAKHRAELTIDGRKV